MEQSMYDSILAVKFSLKYFVVSDSSWPFLNGQVNGSWCKSVSKSAGVRERNSLQFQVSNWPQAANNNSYSAVRFAKQTFDLPP